MSVFQTNTSIQSAGKNVIEIRLKSRTLNTNFNFVKMIAKKFIVCYIYIMFMRRLGLKLFL